MLKIEIFINYYGDGTHTVNEIYINHIRKAKFELEKGKIDLDVLKPFEGCIASVTNTYIDDIAKNNTKLVKIGKVEPNSDGVNAVSFEDV